MPDSPIQEIACCLGQQVAGNPTQFVVERAFAAAKLDWRYLTLQVRPEDLADAVKGLRAMGFQGGNLTGQYQAAVIPHLDELSETAELVGAVDCIIREGDRLLGDNTGGRGFVQALREVSALAGKRVVIFGAGAAARAIAVEIARSGAAALTIVNRTAEPGQELADLLGERLGAAASFVHLSGDYCVPDDTNLVINATSIGSDDEDARMPLEVESLRPEMVVADVTLNPPHTRLLRDADARSCTIVDGLGMFVCQTAIAFKAWTGVDPDGEVMREALEEFLEI